MKRILLCLCCLWVAAVYAQNDSTSFKGYFYNKDFGVYLRINFHRQNIIIPGEELLGEVPGYLGKEHNSFCWPIISVEVKGKKASLQMVNDYGSEDLEATLTRQHDSIYVLKQGKGSTIKVPNNAGYNRAALVSFIGSRLSGAVTVNQPGAEGERVLKLTCAEFLEKPVDASANSAARLYAYC